MTSEEGAVMVLPERLAMGSGEASFSKSAISVFSKVSEHVSLLQSGRKGLKLLPFTHMNS